MNNKSNVMNDFIKPIIVLLAICMIATGALAYTEQLTTPIIKKAEEEKAIAARMEVLPGADSFTTVALEGMPQGVSEVYTAANGTVVILSVKGYGGPLKMIVGIDNDGKIVKSKVLSNSETQGLGSKVANESKNNKPVFQTQFIGKDEKLEGVDTIAGATISSNAYINGIKKAFEAQTVAAGGEATPSKVGVTEERLKAAFPNTTEFISRDVDGLKVIFCGNEGVAIFTTAKGYSGEITVATLIDPNKVIVDVIVDSHTETESIGGEAIEEGFTDSFIGKNDNQVDTVAGATVTTNAIKTAVKKALAAFDTVKEGM